MKKIIVISDTHGQNEILNTLVMQHQDAYAFLHLGDLEDNEKLYPRFKIVRVNNDYFCDLPRWTTLKVDDHRIFMLHSEGYYGQARYQGLSYLAKQTECDIVLYGHTHRKDHSEYDGITFINPGSATFPRDGSYSYAILNIDKENIDVQFVEIESPFRYY